MIWERYRKGPEPLPHQQIVALSATVYRSFMAKLEKEPGEPSIWIEVTKLLDRVAAKSDGFEKFYGADADQILLENGIVTDDHSQTRLLQEIDRAFRQAAEQQLPRAGGDRSPDPKAGRFPALATSFHLPSKVAPKGLTIRGLFALWERDRMR
jgi:hypothetical protein